MVNHEAAAVLLETAKHIHKWAKKGDVTAAGETLLTKRAHENAWRAMAHLIPVLEHAKESDQFWKLLEIAERSNKGEKEQRRLYAIARQEDRGFMERKLALEEMVEEALQFDKLDPKGLTDKADEEERRKSREAQARFDADYKALTKEFAKLPDAPKHRKAVQERQQSLVTARDADMDAAAQEKEAVYLKLGLTPLAPSDRFLKAQKKAKKAAGVVIPKHHQRVPFWQTKEYLAANAARKKEREEREKREAAGAPKQPTLKKSPAKRPAATKTATKKVA